jgi:hypothetical protein
MDRFQDGNGALTMYVIAGRRAILMCAHTVCRHTHTHTQTITGPKEAALDGRLAAGRTAKAKKTTSDAGSSASWKQRTGESPCLQSKC